MNQTITVHLLKPLKQTVVTYQGELLRAEAGCILLRARWLDDAIDLGYVRFAPGDVFDEYYYTDRWFNIFEVRGAGGALKGWYCNITRPARLEDNTITSEDLELDLFVSPDRRQFLTLDMDEFEARDLAASDPPAHAAALAALAELVDMARAGKPPFGSAADKEYAKGFS